MALAKKTSVLREAMLLFVKPCRQHYKYVPPDSREEYGMVWYVMRCDVMSHSVMDAR